jgi:hypothetical protein
VRQETIEDEGENFHHAMEDEESNRRQTTLMSAGQGAAWIFDTRGASRKPPKIAQAIISGFSSSIES